ncbi:MAG: 4Fe-4S dicluster domain-containing protein [Pseudomonadota bacterium]
MHKKLLANIDWCIGCFACEVACKQEHQLPEGPKWIKVVQVGPEEVGGKLVMDFVPMHCRHCENPPCLAACPVDAITKRSDGLVLFNEELCIGCVECLEACPFGAPQLNPAKGVVQACNLCFERVDQGFSPACVQNCPTQALVFGDPNSFSDQLRQRQAEALPLGRDWS